MGTPLDDFVCDAPPEVLNTPFGSAHCVPLQTFLDVLLPGLPVSIDFESLVRRLRRQKSPAHRIVTKNGRLWGYSRKQPVDFERSDAFKYIYTCVDRLAKVLPLSTQRYRLHHNDDNAWYPDERNDDSFPDAYLCRIEDGNIRPTWRTIALSGAYALTNSERMAAHNMRKVTRAMANCIFQDPRRRFTYGYTIECSDMRLWYCDRANIIMSQSFDFTSDYRTLLSFLLRVTFAEDHTLGFDPTMTVYKTLDDGTHQYHITLRSVDGTEQVYRTKQLLSNGGGAYLMGRGTRVWDAVRIENGVETGESVALKDSWVEEHRTREPAVNLEMRTAAASQEERDQFDHLAIPISAFGDVYVAGVLDRTREVPASRSVGHPGPASSSTEVEPQVHSRIVYKDVGRPLRHVCSVHRFFSTLAQVAEDMRFLHKKGWVHCDVSPGNIIVVDGRPKLSDFEYARHESDRRPHEMIGAREFRPAEVELEDYFFMSDDSVNFPLPPFRYFPLHDLESLWWIGAHFIIARAVTHHGSDAPGASCREEDELDQTFYEKHRQLAADIFGSNALRSDLLTVGFHFYRRLERLHPSIRVAGQQLVSARRELVRTFKTAEADVHKMDFHCADGVHEILRDCFADIAAKFEDADFYMEPVPYK